MPSITGGTEAESITPVVRRDFASKDLKDLRRTRGLQAAEEIDSLYHVLLATSNISHDVFAEIEKLRVCGTYTSLATAKAAAHKLLFDGGYEREWFTTYFTQPAEFEAQNLRHTDGLMVYAKAPDGTIFRVSILTGPNVRSFSGNDDGKVERQLYHVLQTNVKYACSSDADNEESDSSTRQTNVEGTFESYADARRYALELLLSDDDDITRDSYAEYDEAKPEERDCGYGENVIVHAVGNDGENLLVSVLKEQEMEAVRLAEAAVRIR